jgi:hypothetical protein
MQSCDYLDLLAGDCIASAPAATARWPRPSPFPPSRGSARVRADGEFRRRRHLLRHVHARHARPASVQMDCNVYLPPTPALTPPASGMPLGISSNVFLTGVALYTYTVLADGAAALPSPTTQCSTAGCDPTPPVPQVPEYLLPLVTIGAAGAPIALATSMDLPGGGAVSASAGARRAQHALIWYALPPAAERVWRGAGGDHHVAHSAHAPCRRARAGCGVGTRSSRRRCPRVCCFSRPCRSLSSPRPRHPRPARRPAPPATCSLPRASWGSWS